MAIEAAMAYKLPDILQNVPSPEEVAAIPGLSHLAEKFPIKKDWPTIILLGRDCMQAQPQTHHTWSKDKCQLAVQTPLGWAIMGRPAKATRPLSKVHASSPQGPRNTTLFQPNSTVKFESCSPFF